ncbi:MAG: hypothetical protein KGH72_02455 [Candidatus Micrarchaeota archaeon]|nr:hypothetical protein [Candidatus Micrarchaeota archaeon]
MAMRLQTVYEFLVTYFWAIAAIALVVVVLIGTGIFNRNALEARVPPGGCDISRPYGPGTVQGMNLVGACQGELPQFVLTSRGPGDYVNVVRSGSPQSLLNITNTLTVTVWVFITGTPFHDIVDKEYQYGMKIDINNKPHACSPSNNKGFCLEWDTNCSWIGEGAPIPNAKYGHWMFLAASVDGKNKYWYANGSLIGTQSTGCYMKSLHSTVTIAAITPGWSGYGEAEWFNGSIANVQIYNRTLTANDIHALYLEGIGGAPIDLKHIAGWWPLNGDAKDYSGNNNTGYIYNQSFYGDKSWQTNYSVP